MSIQAIINVLRNASCDAGKAHHLAHYINQNGGGAKQIDALETYARNALVGINQAERMAEELKAEAEAERSSNIKSMDAAVAAVARAVSEKGESK